MTPQTSADNPLSAAGPSQGAGAPEGLKPAAPSLPAQAWTGDRDEGSHESRPARPRDPQAAGERGGHFVDFRDVWLAYNDDLLARKQFSVEAIDLQVRQGEFIAIVGPSGC